MLTSSGLDKDAVVAETCIDPLTVKPGDVGRIAALYTSHDWRITSSQVRSTGILVRYSCDRCGASGTSIFRIGAPKSRESE